MALVDGETLVACQHHDQPNAHGERILPMFEALLAEAGWQRSSVERIGVDVGPGSFTGLRVGIALADALAFGLGVPCVGVGSLAVMAAAVPSAVEGVRVPLLDARRGEYFVAAYTAKGEELLSPRPIPQTAVFESLDQWLGGRTLVLLGASPTLRADARHFSTPETDWPDATWVARLAALRTAADSPPEPRYVRGPNAIKPDLPPSPLAIDGT